MIRINLLPPEKRKLERTPLPIFIVIVADIAIGVAVLFYVISLILKIQDKNKEIQDKMAILVKLQNETTDYDTKKKEENDLSQKINSIKQSIGVKFKWSDVVDALWDVIQSNPKIWLDSIAVMDKRAIETEVKKKRFGEEAKPSLGLELKCHCAGYDPAYVTKFRNDLKKNSKLGAVFPVINRDIEYRVSEEKDFEERFSLSFTVILAGQ
jgi:uncharacterized protein YoxC